MADKSHQRPHGHHHEHHRTDSEAHHRADSEAEPVVDECAPEREEMKSALHALEAELAKAKEDTLRAVADFQNLQRRTMEQEPRLRMNAAGGVVRNVIPVLDNFDLALAQDPSRMTVEGAIEGLRMVRTELIRALERSGVELIQPTAGDAFDPHHAEAIMQQPVAGIASGHVSMTLQPGYRLGDTVLRAAKVAVAP
ncbi:MAG: nucleotide exchange factor GrpE [Planctomycetes bacterium]|nr:nucleotide exchange factor GrpE [Planctomycetota bacterium]